LQEKKQNNISILASHLVDAQLSCIHSYKTPTEAWQSLCDILETKGLVNILFFRDKSFTMKMEELNNLLTHINHAKALTNYLSSLEVPITDDISWWHCSRACPLLLHTWLWHWRLRPWRSWQGKVCHIKVIKQSVAKNEAQHNTPKNHKHPN
jgi:hypothetical protein